MSLDKQAIRYGKDIFEGFLASGVIWLDSNGHTYMAKASDGVEVQIGERYDMNGMYTYLASHTTPDTW